MNWWEAKLQQVSYVNDYGIHVCYAAAGEARAMEADVDLRDLLDHPFYAPLKDKNLFAQVKVDDEVPVLVWPQDIDLSPELLYDRVMQQAGKAAVP
jgi:hypothetical protein